MFVITNNYGGYVESRQDDTKDMAKAKKFETVKQAESFKQSWTPTEMYRVKKIKGWLVK